MKVIIEITNNLIGVEIKLKIDNILYTTAGVSFYSPYTATKTANMIIEANIGIMFINTSTYVLTINTLKLRFNSSALIF